MKSFNGWNCAWRIWGLTGYSLVAESSLAIRLLICLCMLWPGAANASAEFVEPEMLRGKVATGELPPIAERVPKNPLRVDFSDRGKAPGKYGGALRMLIGAQRNISSVTVSGYARLVGYDENLVLRPDILESFEVEAERKFTFHIRPGHRWSDGHLLTAEDFRYALEDVLLNKELSHGVISPYLLVEERPPKFEILDDLTIRYSWDAPNPYFLPQIAAAQPLTMVLPAHYLKKFHKAYQSEGELKNLMKDSGARTWTSLHLDRSRQYRPENPDLPTLDPWRNTTKPPADYFVFERNPFFHRIDPNGRQLPYIDRIVLYVSSSSSSLQRQPREKSIFKPTISRSTTIHFSKKLKSPG